MQYRSPVQGAVMKFRHHLPLALALVLVLVAFALPCLAEEAAHCQARPACVADVTGLAKTADFLAPRSSSAATLPDFSPLRLIGDCCPNNDASLCPVVAGYSKVVCGFPMCSSSQLSCLYSN